MAQPTFTELAALAAGPGVSVETAVDRVPGIWTGQVVAHADDDETLLVELSGDAADELGVPCVWIRAEQVERFEVL